MLEQAESMRQNLLDFCRRYEVIYCYGAGAWADILRIFLDENNICIAAYYVSNSQELSYPTRWNKPIRHACDLKLEKEQGLILGLAEKHQKEIMSSLGIKKNIFAVSDILIEKIRIEYEYILRSRQLRDMLFFNMPNIIPDTNRFADYEKRIRDFKARYNKIEVLFANCGTVGILQMELVCWEKYYKRKNDTFYLLQTTQATNPYVNQYKEPNSFIIKKFTGHNFATLSLTNLPFWKYFAKREPNFFEWNANYNLDTLIKTCVTELHSRTYFDRKKEYIRFSKDEELQGQQALKEMGIEGEFVCIFNRDRAYYKNYYKNKLDNISQQRKIMDWYRSSKISLFKKTTDFLQTNCIRSVRVGSIVEEVSDFDSLMDYASFYHDDFTDAYLARNCLFFLGDSSGVNFFYSLFSKPMVITNYPVITTYYEGVYPHDLERDLILYHKFWSKKERRYLTLTEMLEIEEYCLDKSFVGSGTVRILEEYHRRGIIPVSNTEEEIRQAAQEMLEKVKGIVLYSDEDEKIQAKFWDILNPYIRKHKKAIWCNARVARYFLKENPWMIQ